MGALHGRMRGKMSDMRQTMVDQVEHTKEDVGDMLSPRRQIDSFKQNFRSRFHSMFSPRRVGQNVQSTAPEVGEEIAEADNSLMECLEQFVTGKPEELLQCSIRALSLCIDMVRSMFGPE